MPSTPEPPDQAAHASDGASETQVLSVNQLVAYNLMRLRRSKGWTQQETAEKLSELSRRKWTAATLSASERSWQTGRSRDFNADELVSFGMVFDCPIPYFFVPIKENPGERILYAMERSDAREDLPALVVLDMQELLDLAVPVRYPSMLVDQVNELRKTTGVTWSPSAHVEWYGEMDAASDAYERYMAEEASLAELGEEDEDPAAQSALGKLSAAELGAVIKKYSTDIAQEVVRIAQNEGVKFVAPTDQENDGSDEDSQPSGASAPYQEEPPF